MHLNMEPYTLDAIARGEGAAAAAAPDGPQRPANYYDYDLVGVLVHKGTVDSGHYYSYIKVRAVRVCSDRWCKF